MVANISIISMDTVSSDADPLNCYELRVMNEVKTASIKLHMDGPLKLEESFLGSQNLVAHWGS
jgi:hypothetical protein